MPHHNPPQFTELMRLACVLIYGASRPVSARDLAHRIVCSDPTVDVRKKLNYTLQQLERAGHIRAVRENAKVVTYVAVHFAVPINVLKEKGRKSNVTYKTRQIQKVVTDGSTVTMLDTGFLTNGVRQVQNGQHEVKGMTDDEDGNAPDARCSSGAG